MESKLNKYFEDVDENKIRILESLLKDISDDEYKTVSLKPFQDESIVPNNDDKWKLGISGKKPNAYLYIYCGMKIVGTVRRHTGIRLSELFSEDENITVYLLREFYLHDEFYIHLDSDTDSDIVAESSPLPSKNNNKHKLQMPTTTTTKITTSSKVTPETVSYYVVSAVIGSVLPVLYDDFDLVDDGQPWYILKFKGYNNLYFGHWERTDKLKYKPMQIGNGIEVNLHNFHVNLKKLNCRTVGLSIDNMILAFDVHTWSTDGKSSKVTSFSNCNKKQLVNKLNSNFLRFQYYNTNFHNKNNNYKISFTGNPMTYLKRNINQIAKSSNSEINHLILPQSL